MTRVNHFVFTIAFLFGCFVAPAAAAADGEPGVNPPIRSAADLNRKRLGVIEGTSLDLLTNSALDFTQIFYYESSTHQIEALLRGEIDASVDDLPVNTHLAKKDPRLYLLPDVLMDDEYAFAMRFADAELYEKINTALKALLADGSVDRLEQFWVEGDDDKRVMPPYNEPAAGRVLRFGVSSISPPFCYPGPDGAPVGLEIELMRKIADALNFRLRVVDMEFSELMPSLLDGSVDIIGSCLSVTDERKEVSRFTESFYHGGVSAVVVRRPEHADETE